MNELCISGARVRGKADMERDIQRNIEAEPKEQETRAQGASQQASVGAGLMLRNRVEVVSERCWLAPFSSSPPSWENCPPLGQIYPSSLKRIGAQAPRGGPLSLLGAYNLRDLVCFSGYWERDKYLTGQALRIFYIINKGLLGL